MKTANIIFYFLYFICKDKKNNMSGMFDIDYNE